MLKDKNNKAPKDKSSASILDTSSEIKKKALERIAKEKREFERDNNGVQVSEDESSGQSAVGSRQEPVGSRWERKFFLSWGF